MERTVHGVRVRGRDVDEATRCAHYHGPDDVVAFRFPCCDVHVPCHRCHAEVADHDAAPWKREAFDERAVLCGACGEPLRILDYLDAPGSCPACGAAFNPGCRRHHHLYFEVEPKGQGSGPPLEGVDPVARRVGLSTLGLVVAFLGGAIFIVGATRSAAGPLLGFPPGIPQAVLGLVLAALGTGAVRASIEMIPPPEEE